MKPSNVCRKSLALTFLIHDKCVRVRMLTFYILINVALKFNVIKNINQID